MPQPDINPALDAITSSLFRVSAKLLIVQGSKLLVVEEAQGWYGLPGGGVDHGESVIEGMIREIHEELGCQIDPRTIAPTPALVDSLPIFDGIPRLTLFYTRTDTHTALTPQSLELHYRWVTLDEFMTLDLAPNIQPVSKRIVDLLS